MLNLLFFLSVSVKLTDLILGDVGEEPKKKILLKKPASLDEKHVSTISWSMFINLTLFWFGCSVYWTSCYFHRVDIPAKMPLGPTEPSH